NDRVARPCVSSGAAGGRCAVAEAANEWQAAEPVARCCGVCCDTSSAAVTLGLSQQILSWRVLARPQPTSARSRPGVAGAGNQLLQLKYRSTPGRFGSSRLTKREACINVNYVNYEHETLA
ncbi:hypothetical protein BaRGS_00003771, partial [Batillaria attramentaria]